MKKLLVSIVFTGILSSATYAQLQDQFRFSINQLRIDTVENFVRISMGECVRTYIVGAPELPCVEVRYVIPFNKRVASITITDSLSQSIRGSYLVYPSQPDFPTNEPPPAFVEPDSAIYASDVSLPGLLVELAGQYYEKGHHIVRLRIYPLAYKPLSLSLQLYTSNGKKQKRYR